MVQFSPDTFVAILLANAGSWSAEEKANSAYKYITKVAPNIGSIPNFGPDAPSLSSKMQALYRIAYLFKHWASNSSYVNKWTDRKGNLYMSFPRGSNKIWLVNILNNYANRISQAQFGYGPATANMESLGGKLTDAVPMWGLVVGGLVLLMVLKKTS